jgi:hypothetical protein
MEWWQARDEQIRPEFWDKLDNVGCILGKIKPVLLMGAQWLNPSTIDHWATPPAHAVSDELILGIF